MIKEIINNNCFKMFSDLHRYEAYSTKILIDGRWLPKSEFVEFAKEVIKQDDSANDNPERVAESIEFIQKHGE